MPNAYESKYKILTRLQGKYKEKSLILEVRLRPFIANQ